MSLDIMSTRGLKSLEPRLGSLGLLEDALIAMATGAEAKFFDLQKILYNPFAVDLAVPGHGIHPIMAAKITAMKASVPKKPLQKAHKKPSL